MAQLRTTERPVTPRGTRTRASANKRRKRFDKAQERARQRLRFTQIALATPGSLRAKRRAIEKVIKREELDCSVPCRQTIANWLDIAAKGPLSIERFVEKERTGRPPNDIHESIVDLLTKLIEAGRDYSAAQFHRITKWFSKRYGIKGPSEPQISRFLEKFDLARRSAARHGARAATADAQPHPPIPVDHTHEIWVMDAFDSPVWIRVRDFVRKLWIAVRVSVILVIDAKSDAIISYHVADPMRRGVLFGADADDVLAAFLSAALIEVAPSATRELAGYLPKKLRWDGAQAHKTWTEEFAKKLGIEVVTAKGKPWRGGRAERTVSTIKALCKEIPGHIDYYLPAGPTGYRDGPPANPKATRTKAAATASRVTTKTPIEPADLLSVNEFDAELGKLIGGVHNETPNRKLGPAPRSELYHMHFPRAPIGLRPGRDALALLQYHLNTVSDGKIEHRNVDFMAEMHGHNVGDGQRVAFRADPLCRGIWADLFGTKSVFLYPADTWARRHHAEDVAREIASSSRELSDVAAESRREVAEEQFGRGAVERGQQALDRLLEGKNTSDPGYVEHHMEEVDWEDAAQPPAPKLPKKPKPRGKKQKKEPGPENKPTVSTTQAVEDLDDWLETDPLDRIRSA